MAAGLLPAPGTKYGPCEQDCIHHDCEANRKRAESPCVHCDEPIGYERPFFHGDDYGFAHASCTYKQMGMTTMPEVETCRRCGKIWLVTTEPRKQVLYATCTHVPRLPVGEVRRSPDGIVVVKVSERWQPWRVIGENDPTHLEYRYDWSVIDWERIGNVLDFDTEKQP